MVTGPGAVPARSSLKARSGSPLWFKTRAVHHARASRLGPALGHQTWPSASLRGISASGVVRVWGLPSTIFRRCFARRPTELGLYPPREIYSLNRTAVTLALFWELARWAVTLVILRIHHHTHLVARSSDVQGNPCICMLHYRFNSHMHNRRVLEIYTYGDRLSSKRLNIKFPPVLCGFRLISPRLSFNVSPERAQLTEKF